MPIRHLPAPRATARVALGAAFVGLTLASAPVAAGSEVVVDVRSQSYAPSVLTVARGTTVRWSNTVSPSRVHDVVSSIDGLFDSSRFGQGESWSYTFSSAGSFNYICSIHDEMLGAVIVPLTGRLLDTPTGPIMRIRLATHDLPAGSPFRHVVLRRDPGNALWTPWRVTRAAIAEFRPDAPGAYEFVMRVRNLESGRNTGRAATAPSSELELDGLTRMATPSTSALVAHLLRRTSFGPFPGQVAALVPYGIDGAIDRVLSAAEIPVGTPPDTSDDSSDAPVRWWYSRMIDRDAGLHEKMTWFWHGVVTVSHDKVFWWNVEWAAHLVIRQYAMGKYRKLLARLTKEPAMLLYLDGDWSLIGDSLPGESGPNENYARELQELFTIGQPNIVQSNVINGARTLAGWHVNWDDAVSEFIDERWAEHGPERADLLPRPERLSLRTDPARHPQGRHRRRLRPSGDRAVHRRQGLALPDRDRP